MKNAAKVFCDNILNYQEDVKNVLRKMASGIRAVYASKSSFPILTSIKLMDALLLACSWFLLSNLLIYTKFVAIILVLTVFFRQFFA